VEDLRVSPFYQTSVRVEQDVALVSGELQGLSVKRMVAEERFLELSNLQHLALLDPARVLGRDDPTARIVVLVDALDELRYTSGRDTILDWLVSCPELPQNVRFLLTTRPDEALLATFRNRQGRWLREESIDPQEKEVQSDLHRYTMAIVSRPPVQRILTNQPLNLEAVAAQFVGKAEGSFLYLATLFRGIEQELSSGLVKGLDCHGLVHLQDLPNGLEELYAFFLSLIRNQVAGERVELAPPKDSLSVNAGHLPAWEARRERFEKAWAAGDLVHILTQLWADQGTDPDGNALAADLLREKIRQVVKDPETAAALMPFDHPFGAKRPCLDTNYFATYNRPNVTLVNLRQEPFKEITASGITTDKRSFDLDVIVFATGFDAMTGAIRAVHPITGRGGRSLSDVWANGPQTYLGLTVAGFPNLFLITGPGSPSVLSNMAVSIEQHVDWVVDRLIDLRHSGFTTIEPTETAQAGWTRHMADCSALTLHRLAKTWYTGANVPGKPQVVMPYTGGVGPYRSICNEIVSRGLSGFKLTGPNGAEQCNDGEIVRLQPDVRLVLNMLAEMNLPPIESMGAQGARDFATEFNKRRPPGRPVGEVLDGTIPGAERLRYRLYRPASPGPHPIVVYFHGGGWVLGDEQSDDPFCRDMCRRSGMIFVSVGYRRAPEHRFPTAAEDGYLATRWIAHLGGQPGPVLVAGWSAGGNIAAVTCQLARDRGGPDIAGQLLVCPVTDCSLDRPSHTENATGYFLTLSLMYWFWDIYCSPADRTDPRVSPLRGELRGLPPACVVTAEFDPLHDEGIAYAEALAEAGVPVEQLQGRGHFHSSFTMVDVIITGVAGRMKMAEALRRFAGLPEAAGEER
jgi:acetyl esterase/lipase